MIQLFHVSKVYAQEHRALDDVSLRIDKGEFVLLAGPSGAGKSTLLKLLVCAEPPTSGQIVVSDVSVHRMRRASVPYLRRNIGVVFQDFKLLYRRPVFDNVAFALEVLGLPRAEIRRRVTRVLHQVGLGTKLHLLPGRLSGGEQQRVAIARALVIEPAILLADEPTGNLDPALTIDILNLFLDTNIRGTTVVLATHDEAILRRYRQRTLTLEGGRLVEDSR
ncbi:MAG: cell division ATP-binding protein FtsE [Myxococcales bacterium]|nr:cell division ATP-binding protein FtsE [Myxococcales bacterium]